MRALHSWSAIFLGLFLPAPLLSIDPGDLTCPDGGTALRWEGFALPFLKDHCGACHDWTNYSNVYSLRYELVQLVMTRTMPIGAVLDQADIDRFTEFVACGMPREEPRCPPGGSAASWKNFAAPFFSNHCGSCHSRDLSGDDRNGAPPDQNFDDRDTVVLFASSILRQVETAQMPPGGFINRNDQEMLREWIACGESLTSSGSLYQRADPNDDGMTDLSDAVAILDYLFQSAPLDCLDSADSNADAQLDLTDAVYLLEYLYRGGPSPPPPFYGACSGTLNLGCSSFGGCPDP
jgi:hypothetical protein